MAEATSVPGVWARTWRWTWPVALAVAMAALSFGGSDTGDGVRALSEALFLLPLLYLVVAKLRRREASWPVLVGLIAPFVVLRAVDVVPPTAVFAAVALVVLVWGAVDGQLRGSDPFAAQALGMLGFGLFALSGLVIEPDVGRYVVAAGWLFHGGWDFVHLVRDRVVARSYALWCGVLDVGIAGELVLGR